MASKTVRVIYYDLSEWWGDSNEFSASPHKGILAVSITYPDGLHRHVMSGGDYYYVRGEEVSMFNGGDRDTRVTLLRGVGSEVIEIKPVTQLDFDFLRMGVWVDDRTMRIASKRILEREE